MKLDRRFAQALSGGAALTAGALVQAGLGLATQLVLMRLFVPEVFGEFAMVLAMCGLVQVVLSLRLNVLIIRVPNDAMDAERRDRYRAALVWETLAATAATLAWLAAANLISAYSLMLVAALAVGQWSNQIVAFYERGMDYGRIVTVEAGSQAIGHVTAITLALIGVGPVALYLRELVVAMVRLGAFARIGALTPPLWRAPKLAELRALASEARALWLDGVLEGGLARLVVLGATTVGGVHGTGIFAQSQRLATIPHQLLAPVVVRMGGNLFSRIQEDGERRALLGRLVPLTLAGLTVAAGIVAVLAEPLIPPLLGEHWRPAARVVIAMTGVIVFFSSFELLRVYCVSQHRMRLLLAGRLSQYLAFMTALAVAMRSPDPVLTLALGLSATYALSFAVLALGLIKPTSSR